MGKYFTDQERYEFCRRFKISGKTQVQFCRENNLARETLRDWLKAYSNLSGDFINVSTTLEKEDDVLTDEDVRVNMLSNQEIIKKSSHFSRLNRIQILCALNFSRIEIINSLFVFCSNNSKQIKIYYEDEYGAWLLQNRLHDTTFKLPKDLTSGVRLNKQQLQMFLHGLDVIDKKPTLKLENKEYF